MNIKKITYGDSDFGKIIEQNKLYVDKTRFIHELESLPDYIFLIRPRRFGKSFWINLLQYYYDSNRKDQFDNLFKDTFIGKNPTPNKNRYMTLAFNFAMVDPKFDRVQEEFQSYIDSTLKDFLMRYQDSFDQGIISNIEDSFPVSDVIKQENFVSLLYYFGLLSIQGEKRGKYLLKIPNLTILNLMYGYIRSAFEDVDIFKIDIWELSDMITNMAYDGEWKPFLQYLSEQI
jgi:hypothetical protein